MCHSTHTPSIRRLFLSIAHSMVIHSLFYCNRFGYVKLNHVVFVDVLRLNNRSERKKKNQTTATSHMCVCVCRNLREDEMDLNCNRCCMNRREQFMRELKIHSASIPHFVLLSLYHVNCDFEARRKMLVCVAEDFDSRTEWWWWWSRAREREERQLVPYTRWKGHVKIRTDRQTDRNATEPKNTEIIFSSAETIVTQQDTDNSHFNWNKSPNNNVKCQSASREWVRRERDELRLFHPFEWWW